MRAVACAVGAVLALIAAIPAAAAATCPDGREGAGWTVSTATFDNHYATDARYVRVTMTRLPP